jgi:peptide/nickel transport system permease protein
MRRRESMTASDRSRELDVELPSVASEGMVVADAEPVPVAVITELTAAPVKKRKWAFWLPAIWIAVVVVSALAAPILPIDDPMKSDFAHVATGPFTGGHLLGTDNIGRDILSRLIWGSRVALTVGVVAVAVGMIVGGALGLLAGYYRGKVESVLMGLVDIMLAFPALVLVIAITAFLGQSLRNVAIAVAVVATPAFARVARAATLTFAQREFVTAARGMGATNRRILLREILPNVILPLGAFALVVVAVAIVAEGGLAFLGLSVPAPKPSWGSMINDGRGKLEDAPFISLIPSAMMFVTVLAFNLIGDVFRGRFDVREGAI